MTKPSDLFSKQLRDESRFCKTANGAIVLQAVAAWLEGIDIFEPPRLELWEHVDRLCSEPQGKPTDWREREDGLLELRLGSASTVRPPTVWTGFWPSPESPITPPIYTTRGASDSPLSTETDAYERRLARAGLRP